MKKLIVFLFVAGSLSASTSSKVALAAGVTTITVNALEIRATTAKAVKVWKATRHATVKAAKKVAGKK